MAEFSAATRALAALLVVLVSLFIWRVLQQPPTANTLTDAKKRLSKKKASKKKKKTVDQDTTASAAPEASPQAAQHAAGGGESVDASEDDSEDEDAGLSAKQVLARRRFKPKAFGGEAAAAKAAANAEATSANRFRDGQRVLARFRDGPDWFPGVILEVRRGNEYHVKYDDGEVEHHVPHARIKDEAAVKAEIEEKSRSVDPRLAVDSGRSEADDEAEESASSSEHDDGGVESEDGWQVVDKKRRPTGGATAAAAPVEKVDADGLTKRQRENRRKKERKKEVKEMVRAQAQEHGLHARWGGSMTKMKYVAPPTQPSS